MGSVFTICHGVAGPIGGHRPQLWPTAWQSIAPLAPGAGAFPAAPIWPARVSGLGVAASAWPAGIDMLLHWVPVVGCAPASVFQAKS